MRVIYCLFLLLPACAAHVVRCDGRLQPINPPTAPSMPATAPQTADGGSSPSDP